MGFLGGAASNGMQQSYKQNRKLGNRKKPLKERIKGYETNNKSTVHDKKMSPEDYKAFQAGLKTQKKRDQIRIGFLFALVISLSIVAFLYVKSLLGS